MLTWEQLAGWQMAYEQEPWGDGRDDQRVAAQVMWVKANVKCETGNLPELSFPYFRSTDTRDLLSQKEWLDEKRREYAEKKRQRREDTGALDGG